MDTEERRAYKRAWYLKNRELTLARVKARQEANHDAYLDYQRKHREENADEYRAKSRKWKADNQERHRASSREYSRLHADEISLKRKEKRRALKQTVLDAYGNQCACCDEAAYEFLTIDHVNGDGAVDRKALGIGEGGRSHILYAHIIAAGFPEDYRILCFNCNSARGFYGYCPHRPDDLMGVPPNRQRGRAQTPSA